MKEAHRVFHVHELTRCLSCAARSPLAPGQPVAALLFGPSKLPELGKSLGKTVKAAKEAANEFKDEVNNAATEEDEPAASEGEVNKIE